MQQISPNFSYEKRSRGGRISSPRLRDTIEQSQNFEGLENDIQPLQLLSLVKQAGKEAGFTSKMIVLLEHYMILTRSCDWEEGSQPIVYKSLSATAMDLGISERHVQRLEKQLFDVGALTWNDSGNCKRYGQRCKETGRILYAFGVDLSPLAYLKGQLENIIHERKLYRDAWMETKRQISWYRSQIKSVLSEMFDLNHDRAGEFLLSYEAIATRYSTKTPLESMRSLLKRHNVLYDDVLAVLQTSYKEDKITKESCKTDSRVVHKKDTNKNQFNKLNTSRSPDKLELRCFQERSNEDSESYPETKDLKDRSLQSRDQRAFNTEDESSGDTQSLISKTGLQHLTSKQLLNAASPRFVERIPLHNRAISLDDVVEAAYSLKSELFVSQASWGKACQLLTRYGAAVCLLLVDQATQRENNPVRSPAAYFNAMITRAGVGELHLHKSIFGLLKRDDDQFEPANTSKIDKERA